MFNRFVLFFLCALYSPDQRAPSRSTFFYRSFGCLLVLLVSSGCGSSQAADQPLTFPTPNRPTSAPRPTEPAGAPVVTTGQSRGYLTTPSELTVIRQKAEQGIEPYAGAVEDVMDWAERKWNYNPKAKESCKDADKPAWLDEQAGAGRLYARALAYHLTGDARYAEEVKTILQTIMTEVEQIDLEEQQCRLNFGWGTPELVAAADLIEAYWYQQECTGPTQTLYTETTIGTGNCKTLFQNWLIKNPYYVVSLAAEQAQSNWGAAATNTLAYIADYLADRPGAILVHRRPQPDKPKAVQEITLTAGQAYAKATQLMFDRMNGYAVERHSSNACDFLTGTQQNTQWPPVKSQISETGIIPEDARREEQCNIPRYNGDYQNYPQVHLGNNIQQCELLLRRGDSSCYANVDTSDLPNYTFLASDGLEKSTHLYPGRGSLERAIKAIIVDANTEWRHDPALEVAYRYYFNHHTLPDFDAWYAQLDRPDGCDQDICFGTLTHGFAEDEVPTLPPTVAPPQ